MTMHAGVLAFAGYLVWLGAGLGDFLTHRREDLPHTSGLAESSLHLLQLALIGTGVLLWLWLEPTRAVILLLGALVLGHAVVGYLDTRVAFPRRRIGPIEQHLHSVLDMAPWFAWIVIAIMAWHHAPAAQGLHARLAPLPMTVWMAALLPAALCCVLPGTLEFLAAWRARDRLAR